MKFKGTVVTHITFAIVEVSSEIVDSQTESAEALRFLARQFPDTPILLMAKDPQDRPRFRGRADLISKAKSLKLTELPWQEFEVK
jgi:hypothetical protein